MPQCIPQGNAYSPYNVFDKKVDAKRVIFTFKNGFCFFAEIGKYGGADNKPQVLEQRKIKQHQQQPKHNAGYGEKKTCHTAAQTFYPMPKPSLDSDSFNDVAGTVCKKIHADAEQNHVNNTRNDNPFPEFVLPDEQVCLSISPNCYNYIFQQMMIGLWS